MSLFSVDVVSGTIAIYTLVVLGIVALGLFFGIKLIEAIRKKDGHPHSSLELFKSAVGVLAEGVVITDVQGRITYVNRAWEELTGYKLREVRGRNPRILQSGKTPKHVYEKMWGDLGEGRSFVSDEIVNKRKDGSEYVESITIYPVKSSDGTTYYVGVTSKKIKDARASSIQTEFMSLASHQLRTPISVIDWYSESLLSGGMGQLEEKQRRYIREIYNTNRHMMRLVDTLLNTSRIELGTFSITPEPTNVIKVAESVLGELKQKVIEKGITISTEFDPDIPTMRVDKNIIRIVFQNIITNAIRYTKEHGSIWVSLSYLSSGAKVDSNVAIADSIAFVVQDTGIGIKDDDKDKVFSKLFRGENAKAEHAGGSGLGLYIVKSILDQTSGSIWFKSEEGVGSTFYVMMPIHSTARDKISLAGV